MRWPARRGGYRPGVHLDRPPGRMLADAARQRAGLGDLEHRPWPLPARRWLMGQTWRDLLFAHWRVDPERLRRVVPAEIPLDVRDGSCWVGITPFEITGLHAAFLPPLPWISRFGEVNVRTYTTIGGRPGIWFLSLDAARAAAVFAARRAYRLPYFQADISIARDGAGGVRYAARRDSRDSPAVGFSASYRPAGPVGTAATGSLEAFLVERYCLYAMDRERRIHRADIHHPPWPIRPAQATIAHNTMALPYGLELDGEPLLHLAPRNDVVIWGLRPVTGSGA